MDRLMVSVSGVRGVVGKTLTDEIARDFGRAFATMLGAGKTVTIARDTRPSGPVLRDAMAAGLRSCGVNVIDLGVVTTPGAAFMTKHLKADGGVVITASHNPSEYNGIKLLQPIGTGLTASAAERLKEIWSSGSFAPVDPGRRGRESVNDETHRLHIEAVCAVCDPAAIAGGRFKVVLDSANGAGCIVTPMLLARLGCEVISINGEPNGRFAHPPEPVEENLSQLCEEVRKVGADVGFAQDADADRLAIVDERGAFIGEEYTLALSAAFVLRRRKGKLATNLVTSRKVDDVAAAAGCEVVRAPTGEANVVEAMLREGCIFGGEGGGGAIEPRVVPVRNSLVAIAYVLQHLAETGKTVSQLVDDIPRYVMLKTKFPCPAGAAEQVTAAAKAAFGGRPGAKLNDADGLRVDLPDGWVCARASNTEPIMRIIAEAADEPKARVLVDEMRAIADKAIGGD